MSDSNDEQGAGIDEGALGQAASALERALVRFECQVAAAQEQELGTDAQIERAARSMSAALVTQARIAQLVGQLGAALEGARRRQERGIALLSERAAETSARREALAQLNRRYGELGAEGVQVNALVVAARQARSSSVAASLAGLDEAVSRLTALAEAAGGLSSDAAREGFPELHHRADSLGQQLTTARDRLAGAARSLGAGGAEG